ADGEIEEPSLEEKGEQANQEVRRYDGSEDSEHHLPHSQLHARSRSPSRPRDSTGPHATQSLHCGISKFGRSRIYCPINKAIFSSPAREGSVLTRRLRPCSSFILSVFLLLASSGALLAQTPGVDVAVPRVSVVTIGAALAFNPPMIPVE